MASCRVFAALSLALVHGGALGCTLDPAAGVVIPGEAPSQVGDDSDASLDPSVVPVTPVMDAGTVDAPTASEASVVVTDASGDVAAIQDASTLDAGQEASAQDASVQDAGQDAAQDAGQDAAQDAGVDAAPDAASPTHVTFNVGGAIFSGNGCSNLNTTVTASGGNLHVGLAGLRIALPPGSSQLSERKACSVRVPIDIPAGYYVSKLSQSARYGVEKSAHATASLSTHATVMGLVVTPETVQFAAGSAVTLPNGTLARTDWFSPGSQAALGMCNARPSAGLFAANLALSGQRSTSDNLAVSVADFDFREGFELELTACP